ncbi:MAG TPA: PAS domain S-box protein [Casimicrobiaceae bacterium]|nr:PAS domain S-box protein [Casimicrobiaceae bacterium]
MRSTSPQPPADTVAAEPGERMPLRSQLALLVAATMLPLIGLIAYHAQHDAALESDLAARRAEEAARRVAIGAGQALRDTRAILVGVARRPDVRSLDPARCDTQLAELTMLVTHASYAATLRRDGTLVCASATASANSQFSDTDLKRLAQLARSGVGRVVQPVGDGAPIVPLTTIVQDDADRVVGTLLVSVDVGRLRSLGDDSAANDHAIALLDAAGNVLARSSRMVVGANSSEFPAHRITRDDHGHVRARTRSGEQLFGYARVEETDWFAVAAVPARIAFAATREDAARASILGALVIVAASLLAFRFARTIEGSVRALAHAARRIAEGDRTARAPSGSSHETAEIAALLNRMLDRFPDLEARLNESERNLDLVLRAAQEGILVIDASARVTYANDAAARLLGCAAQEEMIDHDTRELPEAFAECALERLAACRAGRRDEYEVRIRAHDGSMRWLCVSATPLMSENGRFEGMLSMLSDVTERKDVGDRLARITKLYWALSQVNEAILRNPDRAQLLAEACRVVVQEGEFVSAFVMLRDREGRVLVPTASAGETAGTLGSDPLPLSSSAHASPSLLVSVMSSGQPEIVDDFFADSRTAAEQGIAKSLGIRSFAVFPLRCEGRVVGVLAVSASDVGYFDIGVTELLRQTAVDLSFALDIYEQIAKRDRTEADLRATNANLERRLAEALRSKRPISMSQ